MERNLKKLSWEPKAIDIDYNRTFGGGVGIYRAALTCSKEIPYLVDQRTEITLNENELKELDTLLQRVMARIDEGSE